LTNRGGGDVGGSMGEAGSSEPILGKKARELPALAVTSLTEIKFDRKDVKAMNVLMCRRLVAALYQVKADLNAASDKESKARQGLPEFVPDQFVVLYGIKSLAIKNINEFLYGVRAERFRKSVKGVDEPEPMLHFFWQACHHGVPMGERRSADDFNVYLDLLAMVARCVSEDHRMESVAGAGAFWNLVGSMAEVQLPLFIYLAALQKYFGAKQADLSERLKKVVLAKGAKFKKEGQSANPPQPAPSYKFTLLGKADLDSRGHLPLDTFLQLCLEGATAQRAKDAKALQEVYATWAEGEHHASFDTFAEMLSAAMPEMPEEEMILLYQHATSGEDPDQIDMSRCQSLLRRKQIVLKRRPGAAPSSACSAFGAAASAASLFSKTASNPILGKSASNPKLLPKDTAASAAAGASGASAAASGAAGAPGAPGAPGAASAAGAPGASAAAGAAGPPPPRGRGWAKVSMATKFSPCLIRELMANAAELT